jgi:O-acetyl-ADP-ribose deacetylase (regulator of RNase III)
MPHRLWVLLLSIYGFLSLDAQPLKCQITDKTALMIEQGDITQSRCECIVNAANAQLQGGGGVCGAIFKAAGWQQLQDACYQFPDYDGVRCPTGEARITNSFNLQQHGISHIIHAVGPDCRIIKDSLQQDLLLTSAYIQSLLLADKYALSSIAFPFISSAIYAFPKERAAQADSPQNYSWVCKKF